MPGASVAALPPAAASTTAPRKTSLAPERKYKCQFCNRAFSRSEHRSRHERSHTKERPFNDGKRRAGPKTRAIATPSKPSIAIDTATIEQQQMEASGDAIFDVEAAAMLVADLSRAGSYEGNSSMDYTTQAMEQTVTYPSGAIAIPQVQQVPWDKFMPQSVSETKAHSITSSASGSFDSQQSFNSTSTAQPHASQLLSISGQNCNGLVPALQSMINSLPRSGANTPVPQSPSVLSNANAGFRAPQVNSDDERNIILDNIRSHDTERAIPEVLSIGALYAFDQDQAYLLHIGSKILVNQFLQHKENFSSRKVPLWTMQSSLLNMIFSSWSGDPKGLEWACSIKSLLANMVAGNRYELKLRQEARVGRQPTRAEWVEDEDAAGRITPEALWNLKVTDEAAWKEQLSAAPVATFLDAHDTLFQGERITYSAFATRVMINALFLEVWYHKRSPEALQDVVTEYKLRLALETWEKSLDLCEPEDVVDLKTVQEALRYHDSYEVAAAMSHARDRVKRSNEMLKVIEECYNCIETAVMQGVRWVARTSPTNWSVEHPLCGMDLMIILSLWLYRLEHDDEPATPEELAMYNKIRQLFERELDDPAHASQLSSVVAKLWGSMLDEVVVWGITRLIGESFRHHSQALVGYVDDIEASSNASTPSMISQGADEDSVY
ncbi:unnamed protein product [Parascedosporium putredinis]|uniref:C2H2-type domain-containing protein n=1 Tax=Parascedosporium putredinis TaxID=1442378 RepID=A0A9P1HD74_9PEZI|nr:unnamed protein product [Parascedosporium putredinis]CAI8003795.1 unnamed protein product [Parascedosporium putredinis]